MKTVLLVDDDPDLRSLLNSLLTANGWTVLEAEDGDTGLRLTLDRKPDVVLCDLLMPRCNGFQFCRTVNTRRSSLPNTHVVVASGSGYAIDRINALEAGADDFITKPIKTPQLLELLDKLAGRDPGRHVARFTSAALPEGPARVKFWGVRGSVPAPGPDTMYYGGNTSCVEVRADGELIILDAGTGIRGLGASLKKEFGGNPIRATILISHTHWDHIQGFPFFAPAYDPGNKIRIFAFEGPRKGLESTLSIQMESPYFPITMQAMPGNIEFQELKSLEFSIGTIKVTAAFMNHPGICVGYRIQTSSGVIAYFPDNELHARLRNGIEQPPSSDTVLFARTQDEKLREFIQDADIVISDAQYDAAEYPHHIGWGHSCVDDVVELCVRANVKQLFLFHHDPDHSDTHIAGMLASARRQAAAAQSSIIIDAAREGVEVVLPKKAALV